VTGYYRHTMWRESVPSAVDHRTYDTPGGLVQYTLHGAIAGLRNEFSAGTDLDWQVIGQYKRNNTGGGNEGLVVLADQKITQDSWGLWALDRLEVAADWNLVLGVRYDDINNRLTDNLRLGDVDRSGEASFAKTTARVGLAWEVTPDFGVYASVGQGFLPPATEELANNPVAQGGFNEGLKPATSLGEEIGIRGGLGSAFSYDVALFHLSTTDDFGRYRMPERPLETFYRNAGDSTRYGLETALGWFPVDALAIRLAYTYSDFTYDTVMYGAATYEGTDLPNAPKHQAYLDAAWQLGEGFMVGASADMVSSWNVDPSASSASVDGYTLVNARVGYRFAGRGWSGEALLSAKNLSDTMWIAFTEPDPDGNSYQPGPGREYFGGVMLRF
jgi:iron complex outermembrane recepter protein